MAETCFVVGSQPVFVSDPSLTFIQIHGCQVLSWNGLRLKLKGPMLQKSLMDTYL